MAQRSTAYSSAMRMNEAIPDMTTEEAANLTAQVGRYARVESLPADAVVDLLASLGLDGAPFVQRSLIRNGFGQEQDSAA